MEQNLINEYVRLYNLAVAAVADESVLPTRTEDQIREFISAEGWLGLREKGIDKQELANSSEPNVWISTEAVDAADVYIGLHFNTIGAMRKAQDLFLMHNVKQKNKLVDKLSHLDNLYTTELNKKTKEHHFAEPPDYKTMEKFQTNQINDERINNIFDKAKQIETEGQTKMASGIVVQEFPSLDLVRIKISKDDAEFQKRIKEIFDIYSTIRTVKSEKAYRAEKQEEFQNATLKWQEEFRNLITNLKKNKCRRKNGGRLVIIGCGNIRVLLNKESRIYGLAG